MYQQKNVSYWEGRYSGPNIFLSGERKIDQSLLTLTFC